jgi:hypothetical protein
MVFLYGIFYSKRKHEEEGIYSSFVASDTIIGAIAEGFLLLLEKLPYWMTKTFIILISFVLFYISFSNFYK